MTKLLCNLLLTTTLCMCHFCAKAQSKAGSDTTFQHQIPWAPINGEDIMWHKRVWRHITLYEKDNEPLRNDPLIPEENVYGHVVSHGLSTGKLNGYSSEDSLFLQPLPLTVLDSLMRCDTAGLTGQMRLYVHHRTECFDDTTFLYKDTTAVAACSFPDQVEGYDIQEDWIFDRNRGQMVVHIAAIAPTVYVHGSLQPLFWLHYPDIRPYMDLYVAYDGHRQLNMTWDEFFEYRLFRSKITRVEGMDGFGQEGKEGETKTEMWVR